MGEIVEFSLSSTDGQYFYSSIWESREDDPDTTNFKRWRNVLIGNDWGCQVTVSYFNYFMFLHVGQKPVQFNSYGAKSQQTNNENIPAEIMKAYKNITSGSVITRSQDISHWKHLSN